MSTSRRNFFRAAAVAATALPAANAAGAPAPNTGGVISLNGEWQFRRDDTQSWRTVTIPHTWQVEPENSDYRGVAWYRRDFEAPREWADLAVRVEFEAVFHSAIVSLNGEEVGRHVGKGYTAFVLDLSPRLRPGARNTLLVRVANSFDESMLPRGRSSDWAHDGGIYRPVQLLVTPKVFIERIAVDADPDLASGAASVRTTAIVRNTGAAAWAGDIAAHIADETTGAAVQSAPAPVKLAPGERKSIVLPEVKIARASLWHFDHPRLYNLTAALSNQHQCETVFGVRKIEIRDGAFYLNGERFRPMGVERMAGSNPEFGMAEPPDWIDHDHRDMKDLNCVYTRVHWPQDRRLLDWCDRHGILMQTEVPTWGPRTFAGMAQEPSADIMNNGLEQLREMIERDRNHPCLFSWGVCNEIGGQNPPAYAFAKRMYEEAKRLDPKRLVTYASHSLDKTPAKDVAGVMDYVMWNEYFESWNKGTAADLARHLDEIHEAFPGKPIVISEYGYCACTADRPEGDSMRADILLRHDALFRDRSYIAGLIFFCYNDYRTHVGDRGAGPLQQRVHGVVDVYGAKKPSWDALRAESSPVESLRVAGRPAGLTVAVRTRATVPAYTLRGYQVRGIAYGFGNIPVERVSAPLPQMAPGASVELQLAFKEPAISRVQVDILRPSGFSTATRNWQY